MRYLVPLTLALAAIAPAQSVNIDVGMNLMPLAPAPSSAYGAAAGQPGAWNAFQPSLAPVPLRGLDGAVTNATLRSDATSSFTTFPTVMASGDDQALMEDFHLTPNLNTPSTWTFEALADGSYTLYTYASDPANSAVQTTIEVVGSSDPAQVVGAGWPGMHAQGQTYARHDVDVSGGTLVVIATVVGGQLDSGVLNGFQLVATGGLGTNYCTPNPNSTGAPSTISASGSSIASSNDLTLSAEGLPPNVFGLFLASQDAGFVMNPGGSAGNLCLGGAIGRYVGPGQIQNSGSAGTFSLTLDLTATPQPSSLVPIVAGETWRFQAWHRDTVPQGLTSNFTDGLEIVFS